jgi:hypothetical protein
MKKTTQLPDKRFNCVSSTNYDSEKTSRIDP